VPIVQNMRGQKKKGTRESRHMVGEREGIKWGLDSGPLLIGVMGQPPGSSCIRQVD